MLRSIGRNQDGAYALLEPFRQTEVIMEWGPFMLWNELTEYLVTADACSTAPTISEVPHAIIVPIRSLVQINIHPIMCASPRSRDVARYNIWSHLKPLRQL